MYVLKRLGECYNMADQPTTREALEAAIGTFWAFSQETFGPGKRTKGIIQHIQKELGELAHSPEDRMEWIDVVILGMDGYQRLGLTASQFLDDLLSKQGIVMARKFPAPTSEDEAVEHIRTPAETVAKAVEALNQGIVLLKSVPAEQLAVMYRNEGDRAARTDELLLKWAEATRGHKDNAQSRFLRCLEQCVRRIAT